MTRLSWEVASNGVCARAVERGPMRSINPVGVARRKALQVDWVRASFGGEPVGFGRYVRIWIDEGSIGNGLTLFMNDYPDVEPPDGLPDACIRWTEWRGRTAQSDCYRSADRRRYVLDELPLRSTLRFFRSDDFGIIDMMRRTTEVVTRGVPLTRIDRQDGRSINFWFCDGWLTFSCEFSPGVHSNPDLERNVEEWLELARSAQTKVDHAPDEFKVAYGDSLWEFLARWEGAWPEGGPPAPEPIPPRRPSPHPSEEQEPEGPG